jgi:hypothetical protein
VSKLKRYILFSIIFIFIAIANVGCSSSAPDEGYLDQHDEQIVYEEEAQGPIETKVVDEKAGEAEEIPKEVDEPPKKAYESVEEGIREPSQKCLFSINCSTVFDNADKIKDSILEILPQDGWIYAETEVALIEGESVFDILLRVTKSEKIHMEFSSNPALNSKYVEGINNLYEFDAGELSGWTYMINGKSVGYGSSSSYPKDGDVIEWVYTCDQGRDVEV